MCLSYDNKTMQNYSVSQYFFQILLPPGKYVYEKDTPLNLTFI